jgi:glucose-6-phosphate 3-dehydrogenase
LRRKEFTWRDGPDTGGTSGALGDLGVHFIDLFSHFFACEIALDSLSVTRQLFVAEKQRQRVCVDDYAEVSGRLLNGIPFELRASKVTAAAECGYFLSIEGEAMSLECRSQLSGRMEVTLVDRNGHRQRWCPARTLQDPDNEVYGWLDSLVEQAEAWRNSIRGQKLSTNPATFDCGHRTQSVLEYLLQYPIDVHEVADALRQ